PTTRSTLFPYTTLFRSGGTNYKDASGSGNVTIAKATAGIVIHDYSGTYDANPHGVTATITGVDAGGTAAGGSFSSDTLTNVPGRSEEHTSELQSLAYLV